MKKDALDKEIELELERIHYSDTGLIFKMYANIVCILGIISACVFVILSAMDLHKVKDSVNPFAIFYIILIGIIIVFLSWVIRDAMIMFYEIHYVIVHKVNNK